jgi:hypothetical protein
MFLPCSRLLSYLSYSTHMKKFSKIISWHNISPTPQPFVKSTVPFCPCTDFPLKAWGEMVERTHLLEKTLDSNGLTSTFYSCFSTKDFDFVLGSTCRLITLMQFNFFYNVSKITLIILSIFPCDSLPSWWF